MIEFRVGQKVVCVDASGGFRNLTRRDHGYTRTHRRRDLHDTDCRRRDDGDPAVRLQEITERKVPLGCLIALDPDLDTPFLASRFRPLVERKTDISVFTKMLRDQEALV
jgi:hypothetical protein